MKTWDFLSMAVEITGYLGYIWAVKKFCKKYLQISAGKELLFGIILFVGWLSINSIYVCVHLPHIVYALLCDLFFLALVFWIFQGNIGKKMLAAAILLAVRMFAGNFCEAFFACLSLFLMHTIKNISEPLLNEWESCLITGFVYASWIGGVCWMKNHLASVFNGKTQKWYILAAAPLLFLVIVFDIASWGATNGVMIRSGGNMGIYYDQIFSHMEFLVLSALSILGAGFYLFGMNKIYLEQRKSSQYHSQIAAYRMLEEQYSQAERLRHDMKNHVIALSGLLEKKEWEKMNDYLRKMEDSGSLKSGEEITGNMVVDALLYQKRKLAEQENIRWECDVQIPGRCCINEFDLCVLFGNLLDNAVEACGRLQYDPSDGRERFINIQAKIVKSCFLLDIKNSADVTENHGTEFMKKAKKYPKEHGIGLLNVQDVAAGYNGIMNIETQNGIFEISVMIPLTNAVHNIKQAV